MGAAWPGHGALRARRPRRGQCDCSVTGVNFRLVERLFAQIGRIMAINNAPTVTTEVVTLARERLVDAPL
jgi:hypothetical protein